MARPLYVPRINNNDDTVRLTGHLASVGARLQKGDPVADIETDKATFLVEAEEEGYVLALHGQRGDTLEVGSILAWIGDDPNERVGDDPNERVGDDPGDTTASNGAPKPTAEPTLKAAILLAQLGLDPALVPASGERLRVEDVQGYLARQRVKSAAAPKPAQEISSQPPSVSGSAVQLSPEERGMLRTVLWHRDEAVPGYVELPYDAAAFDSYSAEFQQKHKLLFSPLLALHAWRLAQAARRMPKLNATILGDQRYQYDRVNLGFTVQSGDALLVVVVNDAAKMSEKEFADSISELQRAAMKRSLKANQASGNTLTFTSMSRWKVSRHMPILPPQTALIVAHSSPVNGAACLGATYDHRVLSGFEAVQALQAVARVSNED